MEAPFTTKLRVPITSPLHQLVVRVKPNCAYWTFEEASGDFIDKIAGYIIPRSTLNTATGIITNGISMPGDSQTPGTGPAFWLPASHGVSLWGWFKMAGGTPTDVAGAFYFTDNASLGFLLFPFMASGAVWVGAQIQDDFIQLPTAIAPGAWFLLCLVWDRTASTMTTWLNTTIVDQHAYTGAAFPDAAVLRNMFAFHQNAPFGGYVNADEMGLGLNSALTADQVTALYNSGSGLTWPAVKPFLLS